MDTNLGWKGEAKYVATTPQIFGLLQDPQERYDIVSTHFTETSWIGPIMGEATQKLMQSYVKYPPRKKLSGTYTGPITISQYERFHNIREVLAKDGFDIEMPSD